MKLVTLVTWNVEGKKPSLRPWQVNYSGWNSLREAAKVGSVVTGDIAAAAAHANVIA